MGDMMSVGRAQLAMVYTEGPDLIAAYAEGSIELVHVWKIVEGLGRRPLCDYDDLDCGFAAEPNPYSFFCPECWEAFSAMREQARRSTPIMTAEGFELEVFWSEEEGQVVILASKDDPTHHQYYHLEEADTVKLTYCLSALIIEYLDRMIVASEDAGEL